MPSGQQVRFVDVIRDAEGYGLAYRFRFVAPGIAGGALPFDEVAADMEFLCNSYAIPRLPEIGPRPSHIIISLSEAETEFGVAAPEITQYFEAYTVEDGLCIWEVF